MAEAGLDRREVSCCFLIDTDGNFLLQQRDNIPFILQPGKIGIFGGHREPGESFVECVIREIREETGLLLAPSLRPIISYIGEDIDGPCSKLVAEFFIVDNIESDGLVIGEGSLIIVSKDQIEQFSDRLTPLTQFALRKLISLRSGDCS